MIKSLVLQIACSVRHGRQTNLAGLPTVIRDRADWCVLCEARERPESEPNRSALVCPRTAYCIEEREEGLRSGGVILALTWPPPGRWTNTRRATSVSSLKERGRVKRGFAGLLSVFPAVGACWTGPRACWRRGPGPWRALFPDSCRSWVSGRAGQGPGGARPASPAMPRR